MANHHLADETFSCEFGGPDIHAQDLCPSISFVTFLARPRESNCYRRGVDSPSLFPVLPISIQEMRVDLPKRGHMPESRRNNSARSRGFRSFGTRGVARTETSGPGPGEDEPAAWGRSFLNGVLSGDQPGADIGSLVPADLR